MDPWGHIQRRMSLHALGTEMMAQADAPLGAQVLVRSGPVVSSPGSPCQVGESALDGNGLD